MDAGGFGKLLERDDRPDFFCFFPFVAADTKTFQKIILWEMVIILDTVQKKY